MINFRYHLVSLVAVFLALAIGIVAGSTVIKESILDQTQQNLDNAERNLKALEDSNAKLKAELDELNSRDDALDKSGAADFLQNRLLSVPVLIVAVDGVDDTALTRLRQSIAAAGADVAGVVSFTDRLGLTSPADVSKLATVVDSELTDPTSLRLAVAARFSTLVSAVADSQPNRVAAAVGAGVALDPLTSTSASSASPSMLASNALRAFLGNLQDAGFAKIADEPDNAESADLSGLRLTVMSGDGAKLDNAAFVYPFLQRMVGGATPSTLAVEATRDGSNVSRGSFVGPILNDGNLRDHVSTVDDAEWFVGRAAAVMALHDLVSGAVGHYGVGDGASDLLPSLSS
jgi:hypothetical protein